MKIWPWSVIDKLRAELALKQKQLDACEVAASGAFHLMMAPEQQANSLECSLFTSALMEVMKLRAAYDKYIVKQGRF